MASTVTVDLNALLMATWASFRAQIVAGNAQLVLPDNLPSTIITTIQSRYSDLINGPVSAIADPALNIIRFTPYAGTTSSTMSPTVASPASVSSADAHERKGKAKIPRPPNAFILYRQHHHPIIKAQCPGIVNNDISKRVAAMWKVESETVKQSWKAKAEEAKEQHLKKHPGYSYQPRKPSEKKRRMTKRKADALQDLAGSSVNPPASNSAQLTSPPQLPLPSFPSHPDNPVLLQFNFDTNAAAIETPGQMIDQHNNSQQLLNYANTPAVIPSDMNAAAMSDYLAANALIPYEQIEPTLEERRTATDAENATDGNVFFPGQPCEETNIDDADLFKFLNEECWETSEQERQQMLSKEVFDWGVFGSEPYEPYAPFKDQ